MPPDQLATNCQIPDWLVSLWGWIVSIGNAFVIFWNWLIVEAASDGGSTALSLIFALNAGFASINSFTKGFLFSLRRDFCKRTAKYRDPMWLASIPLAQDNGSSNLNHREQLADLASAVLGMERNMSRVVARTAKIWKTVMGICAAVTLVCMFIPYYGRIMMFLALPVPLFAWHCHRLRGKFKARAIKACANLETSYNEIVASITTTAPSEQDLMDRISTMLDDKLKALQKDVTHKKRKVKHK